MQTQPQPPTNAVRKAVIPVAGLGTRFLPATKSLPKEMLPLLNKPTIQYVVEEVVAAGLQDVLLVTGRLKRAIEDHFDRIPFVEQQLAASGKTKLLRAITDPVELAHIHYVRQPEPLGLGHAVLQAARHVGGEPFALLLGDDVYQGAVPAIGQLVDAYRQTGLSVVAVECVPLEETQRYGVADLGRSGADPTAGPVPVRDFVEKPAPGEAPSQWAIMGRYVLAPEIFAVLADTPPGKGGEIQLTDALRVLAQRGQVCVLAPEGERFDVGDPLGFVKATIAMALRDPDIGADVQRYVTTLLAEVASVEATRMASGEAAAERDGGRA